VARQFIFEGFIFCDKDKQKGVEPTSPRGGSAPFLEVGIQSVVTQTDGERNSLSPSAVVRCLFGLDA